MKNKNEKKALHYLEIITAALIIGLLIGLIIAFWLIPDRENSEKEKRSLAKRPEIKTETLLSGEFMDNIESYFKDQFPLRDVVMSIKTDLTVALGKISSQGVYLTKDNNLVEVFKNPGDEKTRADVAAINDFAKNYSDIKTTILLAPTAIAINKDSLREATVTDNQGDYIDNFYSLLSEDISKVNVKEVFQKNKNEMELYYKTDHHWTTDGAYIAYQEYANTVKLEDESVYKKGVVTNSFSGSLVSKSGFTPKQLDAITIYMPEIESNITVNDATENKMTATLYVPEALEGSDPYQVFLGGNHPKLVIKTDAESEKRLLVFKDSYANCFLPFLLSNYAQITVIDPRYYYEDIDLEIKGGDYTDALFLFNANTLSQDKSLSKVLNNVQ